MRSISNSVGSDSDSSFSGEAGDITSSFTGQNDYQKLIGKANTVPLTLIFKHYGYHVDEFNRKIVCPFKNHKGGRESTPSFYYTAATNSFRCYGCGVGHRYAHGCEFVAALEGISKIKAAIKILELFSSDVSEENVPSKHNFSERLEIMMEFSNIVREFRQAHANEVAEKFIEEICWVYDQHNLNHEHTNEALRRVVERLKKVIISYDGE